MVAVRDAVCAPECDTMHVTRRLLGLQEGVPWPPLPSIPFSAATRALSLFDASHVCPTHCFFFCIRQLCTCDSGSTW